MPLVLTENKIVSMHLYLDELTEDQMKKIVDKYIDKLFEKLNDGKDDAFMSKQLATIFKEVPLGLTFEDIKKSRFALGKEREKLCVLRTKYIRIRGNYALDFRLKGGE